MKTVFPFLLFALAFAAPGEDELVAGLKYAETGKSWKVKATASGTSSEFFIHLLQSKNHSPKGVGNRVYVDGRFPTLVGDNVGLSMLKGRPALSRAAFCPKSDKSCRYGTTWTARQTDKKEGNLLETRVVFQNSVECDSFIAEWNDVCYSWQNVLQIKAYLKESDWKTSNVKLDKLRRLAGASGAQVTSVEVYKVLDAMISLVQGLKDTGPLELIETVVPGAHFNFDKLDTWKAQKQRLGSEIAIQAYLHETDFNVSLARLNKVFRSERSSDHEFHNALKKMINLVQGLKETGPVKLIETLVRDCEDLFAELDVWKSQEIRFRSGKEHCINSLQDLYFQPRNEGIDVMWIKDRIDSQYNNLLSSILSSMT
jgi:hypothetical protein